jgi:hypothetical protein
MSLIKLQLRSGLRYGSLCFPRESRNATGGVARLEGHPAVEQCSVEIRVSPAARETEESRERAL